jgi:uncharacterized membrane protein YccC
MSAAAFPSPFRIASLLSPVPLSTLRFAGVTTLAALSALFLAFWLELESPYWAATTVLIVAQPRPGQVVGKGAYRAIGTVAGAGAGAVLIALFAQAPELFFAGMAVWIAACTSISTLLRGFRSYGAVLAGYTAAIVAFSAVANPEQVFDIAVARASAILLGILCGAVAAALLIPGRAKAELLGRLAQAIEDAADLLPAVLAGRTVRAERRKLTGEIAALEALSEAAQSESLDLQRRLGSLHGALADLFAAISALRAIDDRFRRLSPADRETLRASMAIPIRQVEAELMEGRAERNLSVRAERLQALGERLRSEAAGQAEGGSDPISAFIVQERAGDAAAALGRALDAHAALAGNGRARRGTRLAFHRDPGQAFRNGLRALIAVSAAAAFWVVAAWPAGGTFVTNVCVACSLFATQPRPSAAALGFMRGAAVAIVLAGAVKFLVLPWLDGFGLLAMTLAPVIMAGTILTTIPGWFGTATAFNVLFLSTVAPTNPMTYDLSGFLESAVATMLAFLFGATVFRTVLPTSPQQVALGIARQIRRDLSDMAAAGNGAERGRIESLIYDRLGRMFALTQDEKLLAGGVSALGIGLELARLRAEPLGGQARTIADTVLAEIARPPSERGSVLPAVTGAVAAMNGLRQAADGPERASLLRAEAALAMIADAVAEHPDFFGPATAGTTS